MKVLFGWELGAGQGHIQRLVSLAKALQASGCEPVFALKSYNLQKNQLPWTILDPPRLLFSGRDDSYTFADILETFGFANPILLSAHIQAWQALLKTVQPRLVIADHAPGLVLAAQNLVPTVVVGSHFAVPPPVEDFPILRFPAPPASIERQAQVTAAVRNVLQTDVPLGKLLNGDCSFIFSLPELDCYRFWRTNPQYVGVHITPLPSAQPKVNGSSWAYLNSDYPYHGLVHRTLHPAHDFKPLREVFTQQSLVIHHGGLTTSIGCLLAGVPQLILPRYLEQELNAIALTRLGVAQMIIRPTWESLLMAQVQTTTFIDKARDQANCLAQWNQNFLDVVVKSCLSLLH